jgi:hypothetical protein
MGTNRTPEPYDPKKFAENKDEIFTFTHRELMEQIDSMVKPLEEKAYEAGRLAGRTQAQKLPSALPGNVNAEGGNPHLRRRANELQDAAKASGRKLSNIDAIREAYVEAGVPLR